MTKRRVIAIAALVIWVLLLLVAMIGGDLFPTLVKSIAGAVSIGLLALVMPVSSIVGLRTHQPGRPNALATWAIGKRWGYAIAALWAIFIGTLLLVPSSRPQPGWYRIFGACLIAWGLVVAWATYLGFRGKRREGRSA